MECFLSLTIYLKSLELNGTFVLSMENSSLCCFVGNKNKVIVIVGLIILVPFHARVSTARKTCGIENTVRVVRFIANRVRIFLSLELLFKSSHTVIRNLLCMCFGN